MVRNLDDHLRVQPRQCEHRDDLLDGYLRHVNRVTRIRVSHCHVNRIHENREYQRVCLRDEQV